MNNRKRIAAELREIFGLPPAKRAKRLPNNLVCSCCGGPLRSKPGEWLRRGEYAVACLNGCYFCEGGCNVLHRRDYACTNAEVDQISHQWVIGTKARRDVDVGDEDGDDDNPF